ARHRDDLLRDDVERIAWVAERLHRAGLHALGDRGAREQVAAIFGDDDAGRGLVDAVAGAADALHPARDRGGRFHLDDEVDRPHVDAELERARRDERGEPARLEVVLDAEALLARDRTVVRVYELLAGELVQRRGEPLREASRIHEDQGRAVRADQLEQPWMDRWPDRGALHRRDGTARDLRGLAQARHVLDRHLDAQLERLAPPGVEHAHGPRRSRVVEAAEEARDLVQRALCRG